MFKIFLESPLRRAEYDKINSPESNDEVAK